MIDFLARLLGYVMKGCYWLTNNYVVALLLFAVAMQLLLCPFGIKQQKNMVKQARLRPKEMAIRNKYKGRTDQVTLKKMQNEIMELYQKEGYSQLAGCLPLILQLVIIFPLYQVVIRPLEFISGLGEGACGELAKHLGLSGNAVQVQLCSWLQSSENINSLAPVDGVISQATIDTIKGLSTIPNVSMFGQDLGINPWDAFGQSYWWLIFIPVLNLGFMYLSQFLSRKMSYQNPQAEQMNNSSMKIMMYVLPLMTMFITFQFAAAIGIYWIFRTLLSMLQQFIFYKTMPYPQFTEEDYKKAEREMRGTRKNKKSEAEYVVQPGQYRSLHHIDD
ncbi:MAG: membrane protein insertase YidC [Clostridia bacterium]|nr:membrane protein insertase YidC [Clostridia bacterium]